MGITVLGPLTVDGSGRLSPRDRVVLQALVTRAGHPVSVDELVDALWGDQPPASAAKILQGCIVRLRKELGPEAIDTAPQGYLLALPPDEVDAVRFERVVGRARELLTVGEADRAAFQLTEALSLWHGNAFAELADWEPGVAEARRLDELRLEAEELRVDALLRTGRHREVLAEAQSMVRSAPLRERRWTLLALAQYQAGNQGEALRTIHRLKSVLLSQLGIDPGPDVVALEQAILRQDASLLSGALVGTAGSSCPWQGLLAYDIADAERFFGRQDDVDACLEIVRRRSLLALVGPSGSGKSSILRAGVAAALQGRGRQIIAVTPGRHPVQSLSVLDRASATAVLCIDQGEEVFSLCEDPDERREFLDTLVTQAQDRSVLVAIRADRLADVAGHAGFSRLVEHGLYLVGALDEHGLRQAVEGPARQSGLILEPGLVDLLVREVRDDPGALPLLSHALLETWKRREGNTLTVAGYRSTGGIHDAVAQSAERLYARVDADSRHLLRDLVLRLVSPGVQGEPVRTRVPRRLIATDAEHDQLIEMLVRARLVTSDDGVLEVSHEALARAWPRLRGWLDDDVEGQRILHHLSAAADAWDTLGRPDSELYRGVRLARALDWQAKTRSALTEAERDFLNAARAASEAEELSAAERARAQARLIRRLRLVLAGAVVLLIVALAAGGVAAVQSDRANENAATAVFNETAAEARRVGARALVTDDIDDSMLLAVAGVRLDDSPETRDSLFAALARHPELTASTQMAGLPVTYFDVSPDGRTVATYDHANHVRLYEIETARLLAEYQAGTDRRPNWMTREVIFSPDGHTLAVGQVTPARQPIVLLDASSLERLPGQPRGPDLGRVQLGDLTFSLDGSHLAATMPGVRGIGNTTRTTLRGWAAVWDLESPGRPPQLVRTEAPAASVALSPDGRTMYTTPPLMIHDLGTDTSVPVRGDEPVSTLTMSPDGRFLASAGRGGVVLRDATTGEVLKRLPGNGYTGWFVSFSSDGTRVATVTPESREALVWDVRTGALLAQPTLGTNGEALDFGTDASTLYTAGADSALRRWDLDGDGRFISEVASTRPGKLGWQSNEQAEPAPSGELVAFPSPEEVRFFDVSSGAASPGLDRGKGEPGGGSWHPDSIHYALATGDEIRVWDARSGEVVGQARQSWRHATDIDFSTDGGHLVTAELSGRVSMLDSTTLAPVGRPAQLDQPVCCVSAGADNLAVALTGPLDTSGFWMDTSTGWALVDLESGRVLDEGDLENHEELVDFSPDGRQAALAGRDGRLLVLDLGEGDAIRPPVLGHHDAVMSLTYSPDGRRILTSGADSNLALWDGSSGVLLARIPVPQRLPVAAFSRDPESVLSVDLGKGPVYEWDTDVDHAVEFACRVAGRGFTEAEWSAQFGDRPYQQTCPDP